MSVTPNGLYAVETESGEQLTTHGPDFRGDFEDPVANHGSGLGPGDPERAPVCAANPDTDRHQEVLYGYWDPPGAPGSANRIADVRESIRAAVRRMNAVLNLEAQASSGGTIGADYIVRCDATEIRVTAFPVTATASGNDRATFNEVVAGAEAAGFNSNLLDYSIFYDGDGPAGVCGTGTYYRNDSQALTNPNNNPGGATEGGYAVSYDGCWYGSVPMHEAGHNQGAVQRFAPFSTGLGAHCYDENDVMCYSPDGGDQHQQGTELLCNDYLHYDCGWNTYFDAQPETVPEVEWLATHWNLGSPNNLFVAFAPPSGNTSPSASFTFSCTGLSCNFTDTSTDDDGSIASRAWDFDDGGSSTATNPSHPFPSPDTYDVNLTVTDNDGDETSLTRPVTVPAAAPPANDDFASPSPLSGTSASASGTNAGATKQPGEPNHVLTSGGDGGASVWYRWTAPTDGTVSVDTCASNFDTLLAVYKSNDDITAQPRIGDNDDSAGPGCSGTRRSELTFAAEAGTTYRIAVDGYDSPTTGPDDPATGNVALTLAYVVPAAPPATQDPAPTGGSTIVPPGGGATDPATPLNFPAKVAAQEGAGRGDGRPAGQRPQLHGRRAPPDAEPPGHP